MIEKVIKPWGFYITKVRGKRHPSGCLVTSAYTNEYWIKFLVFNPCHSLSLQSHLYREEHWEVTMGFGLVTIGDKVQMVKKGWKGKIPAGVKHRAQNDGPGLLVIKEYAEGPLLSETDLVRYEDQYGRM